MSFFLLSEENDSDQLPVSIVDINSEIDYLFDICIPFPRLYKNSRAFQLDDFVVAVASIDDPLFLKEKRTDKTAADLADIEYLKALLQ